jgi:hypothetical protein
MVVFGIVAGSKFRTTLNLDISVCVTLEDGETVHNAFFDRNFRVEDEP